MWRAACARVQLSAALSAAAVLQSASRRALAASRYASQRAACIQLQASSRTLVAKAKAERARRVLRAIAAQRSDADVTALTSCLLDALMFAGGQSIPSVLAYALALPYSKTRAAGAHGRL